MKEDLFHDRWKMTWNHLSTCHHTKFQLEDPGNLHDSLASLDHLTLGLAIQAIMGHNYLNYHHDIVGNISEQICQFCWEEHEEFIHLVCECTALTRVCLDTDWGAPA